MPNKRRRVHLVGSLALILSAGTSRVTTADDTPRSSDLLVDDTNADVGDDAVIISLNGEGRVDDSESSTYVKPIVATAAQDVIPDEKDDDNDDVQAKLAKLEAFRRAAAVAAVVAEDSPAAGAAAETVGSNVEVSVEGHEEDYPNKNAASTDEAAEENLEQEQKQPRPKSSVFGAIKRGTAAAEDGRKKQPFVKMGSGGDNITASSKDANREKAAAAAAATPIPKRNVTSREDVVPPEGYILAAHVVTDPSDGLSYFSAELTASVPKASVESMILTSIEQQHLEIPYQECSSSGSTTQAIKLKSGHFRHLPPGAQPHSWTTATSTKGGNPLFSGNGNRKDPQLLVALKPLELTVSGNGGESRSFNAGDCVLLEDTVGKGHKIKPVAGEELNVLMLTLPRHHHHQQQHHSHTQQISEDEAKQLREQMQQQDSDAGNARAAPVETPSSLRRTTGRHLSVLGLRKRGVDKGRLPRPCRVLKTTADSARGSITDNDGSTPGTGGDVDAVELLSDSGVTSAIFGDELGRRRAVLGTIGIAISGLLVYFMVNVCPPILAGVGVAVSFVGGAIAFDSLVGTFWTEIRSFVRTIRNNIHNNKKSRGGDDDDQGKDDEDAENADNNTDGKFGENGDNNLQL